MSDYDGFKRKSTRTAAIEAAKRIKNTADANKLLSHGVKQEYHFNEAKMVKPVINATIINTERRKGCNDSIVSTSKGQVHDLSKKITRFVEANPPKRKDMPKRGRGRPPKVQSAKYSFTSNTSSNYDDIIDVNVRRESYNTSLLKSEPSSPKQLQPGNGGITYKESLMKFCKNLGPTTRRIALRKLLGQGLSYQARHRLEPSSDFLDVSSTNGSVRINTTPNQVSQPLIGFGALRTYATTADYKGKRILVDDGSKSNFNKWGANDIEFLLGKQKSSLPGGYNGSSENQDFLRKNLGYGQVGNWRTINQIGSFLSSHNGRLNRNINQDVEGTPRNVNLNSCVHVHPSTYVQPSRVVSSSSLGMNGGMSSISWVPPPLPPAKPLQKWCLPPPETNNPVVNDGFWREQELQLAMASYMRMNDQQPKVWIEDSWAQNHPTKFPQPDPYGTYHLQQLRAPPPPPPHQVLSYQNLFNNDGSQPPQLWSQAGMFGGIPKQESFPFGI